MYTKINFSNKYKLFIIVLMGFGYVPFNSTIEYNEYMNIGSNEWLDEIKLNDKGILLYIFNSLLGLPA